MSTGLPQLERAVVAEASPSAPPSKGRIAAAAIRPATLWVSVVPVFVGSALAAADGSFLWLPALAALVGALLIQIGTNLVNDAADFASGADDATRLGPARATQRGWLDGRAVWAAAWACFLLALIPGGYLVAVAGWPLVAIGGVSILSGLAYTAGPYPLGYIGLGDVFVLVFFGGVAVGGTYYVQALTLTPRVALAAIPVGLLATAILVVNNLRDRDGDARVGKRTLVVRFGERFGRRQYAACLVLAYGLPALAVALGHVSVGWLLPLVSLPLALIQLRALRTVDGAALNPHLGATARLQLIYGLLAAGGALL
jgi:1,4-dihydroxy-2-naphthoate polyprenyltransferase